MATLEGFNRIGRDNAGMLSLIDRLSAVNATVTPTIHVFAKPLGIAYTDSHPIGEFDDTTEWTDAQIERARQGYRIMETYVLAMHRAGVKLGLGTDTVDPGSTALSELLLLHDAGIAMEDVLAIGTLRSAELIGLSHLYGTIEPGKRANLVLLDQNPLDEPLALLGGKTVIKDGVVYTHKVGYDISQ